ncbi:MAG: hypothetical protein PVG30_04365 [Gammaproteobacteria bacterium]|jgi:hypothetical protein
MYKKIMWILVILVLIPLTSFAVWQIADPFHVTRCHCKSNVDYPQQYVNGAIISFKLRKGLLKENVICFAGKYRWKVRWLAPNKYYVTLATKIVGPTFPIVMNRLLSHYPLRATYDVKCQRMRVYKR